MAQYDDLNDYNWLQLECSRHEMWQAIALGKLLDDKLNPDTVIDFGCGPGIYLIYFSSQDKGICGLDGASGAGEYIKGNFYQYDLRNPFRPDNKYSLALCIEAGEHIDAKYADILMDSICNSANQVFFCAARPNQGGEGHVNEQPQSYWKQKFEERGFEKHPLDDEIHAEIDNGQPYQSVGWLQWNSFLMRRKV